MGGEKWGGDGGARWRAHQTPSPLVRIQSLPLAENWCGGGRAARTGARALQSIVSADTAGVHDACNAVSAWSALADVGGACWLVEREGETAERAASQRGSARRPKLRVPGGRKSGAQRSGRASGRA